MMEIKSCYKCTESGEIHHILKPKIRRNRIDRTITIFQPDYISELTAEAMQHHLMQSSSLSQMTATIHH
jgi:hypothetical protein